MLSAALAFAPGAAARINIKVVEVDHDAREVTVLLPMHNATLRARLTAELEVRVRQGEFYEGKLITGAIGTTKRNLLRLKIPEQRPATFRVLEVEFLSRAGGDGVD